MKGKPTGRNTTRTAKAISKPKVVQVRKRRNVAANKKSSSPFSTSGGHSSCDQESVSSDPSETNFPYDIRFNGVSTLLNVIHKATPEVKDLLMDECEIILECRVCRNLFRSFPNFLCHKQQFCKKLYNPATQSKYGPLLQCAENLYQLQYHIDASLAQPYANIKTSRDEPQSSQESNSECRNSRLEQIVSKIRNQDMDDDTSKAGQQGTSTENRAGFNKPNKRKSTLPIKGLYQEQTGMSSPKLKPKCLSIEPLLNRAQDGIAFQSWMASEEEDYCDKAHTSTKEDTAILGLNGKTIYLGAEEGAEMFLSQVTTENENLCGSDSSLMEFQCCLCQTYFCSEKTLRLHTRKAHCNPLGKEFTVNSNAEILSNKKRLYNSPESGKRLGLSPDITASRTMNPSPTRSLIMKKRRSKLDYKIAKENKNIIDSIFGSKKPTKTKVPIRKKSTIIQTNNTAPTNLNKSQIANSPGHEGQIERRNVPMISTCINCSASFATKGEMSTHLAKCNGVINLAFQRSLLSPERKKICIQIRHNYEKEQSTNVISSNASDQFAQKNTTNTTTKSLSKKSVSSKQDNSCSDLKIRKIVHTGHFNNNINEKNPVEVDSDVTDYHEPKEIINDLPTSVDDPQVSNSQPQDFTNSDSSSFIQE